MARGQPPSGPRAIAARHYDARAREWEAAGMDWSEVLAADAENPRARLARELLENREYDGMEARAAAFVERGGGCRATFSNHRRRLGDRAG